MSKISMKPTHPSKKGISRTLSYTARGQKPPIVMIDWKKKTTKFKSGFKQIIKTYPKNYVWLAYWKKISNFFRLGTQWPKNYYIFWSKFNPTLLRQKNPSPSNFGTLNPPRFSVQEPHKHIFVMTQKRIYFCNSSLFLSSEPKKKFKKSTKKEKFPKNK